MSEEARKKMSISHTGLHHSLETRKKISLNSANRGKPMNPELKELLRSVNIGMKRPYANPPHEFDEKSSRWRGDKVGPSGVRQWLYRKFGKATRCENPKCIYPRKNANNVLLLKAKNFTWVNKSGDNLRDRDDWFQLCVSCNRKFFGQ